MGTGGVALVAPECLGGSVRSTVYARHRTPVPLSLSLATRLTHDGSACPRSLLGQLGGRWPAIGLLVTHCTAHGLSA